jgi:AcrR family transcriptional regulator
MSVVIGNHCSSGILDAITNGPIMAHLSTQQRLLAVSAELFNRYGVEAVSVGQIAEAMKISPGNLTYHFKKKSDLIAKHVDAFEHSLQRKVDSFPVISNPKNFSKAYLELIELVFGYRFLFIGANYLIQNDLVKTVRYAKLINDTKKRFARQIDRLVSAGYMKPVRPPYSVAMLVDSIWWQWLGFLLAIQIKPLTTRPSIKAICADAALHIVFLNHHYVDPTFFRAVQAEFKKYARRAN